MMPERPPSFESNESREEKMVRIFRERGLGDAEAMKLLIEWTQEREAKNEKSEDRTEARILFELDRARLYIEIGNHDGAGEAYEDARTMAWNENRHELYQTIMAEMDKLDQDFA